MKKLRRCVVNAAFTINVNSARSSNSETSTSTIPNRTPGEINSACSFDESSSAEVSPAHYHAWFNRRMQALQKERQSPLRKLLSAVVGD